MLDKFEYYHGAAIISLMANKACKAIQINENGGYILNGNIFIFLKYRTKARSPWQFNFDRADIDCCVSMSKQYSKVILGLICGGDGICGLDWSEMDELLAGNAGWISARRKHNHSYSVQGSVGELKRKIPLNRWSLLAFEQDLSDLYS